MPTIQDFEKLDIRVGKVIAIEDFPEAGKPSFKLKIDFGDTIGIKNSSAQITTYYTKEALLGQLVLCIINFPARQIGPFISEVLTLGVSGNDQGVVLVQPERTVPLGSKLH